MENKKDTHITDRGVDLSVGEGWGVGTGDGWSLGLGDAWSLRLGSGRGSKMLPLIPGLGISLRCNY